MLTGVVGAIKWHYYTAAAINGYTVTRHTETRAWSVVGIVVQSDKFKLSQRPLKFVAPFKGGEWTWPIESFDLADSGRFVARLGPPEKR